MSINDKNSGPFRVLTGLGSNKGDRRSLLISALDAVGRLPGTDVTAVSSLYSTTPVLAEGDDFLNAVAVLKTNLSPAGLLDELKKIEFSLGRTGSGTDARPIDLDIIFFDSATVRTLDLQIPHPAWQDRRFVLIPLLEVCGTGKDPVSGKLIRDLPCMNQKPGPDVARNRGPEWYANISE